MTRKEKTILVGSAFSTVCLIAAILTEGLASLCLSAVSVVGFVLSLKAMRAIAELTSSEED